MKPILLFVAGALSGAVGVHFLVNRPQRMDDAQPASRAAQGGNGSAGVVATGNSEVGRTGAADSKGDLRRALSGPGNFARRLAMLNLIAQASAGDMPGLMAQLQGLK